jgi:THO complex subunit 4
MLSYGPDGRSRGVANVTFAKAESAAKAVQELNGVKVDGRPMKVEVIVDANNAPAIQEPKKLADRISQPKNAAKPKPATETKQKGAADKRQAGRGGRARVGRGGAPRTGRVKKSAEQLDAEMVDYFADTPAQNGGAVQGTNGDQMADVE